MRSQRSLCQKKINPARHSFNVITIFPENLTKLQWILCEKWSGQSSNPSNRQMGRQTDGQMDGWTDVMVLTIPIQP